MELNTIVTIAIAIVSGAITFVIAYFTHLLKFQRQIAQLEGQILDKQEILERLTRLEEKDLQKQKVFEFLNDQVLENILKKDKK